MKNKESNKNLSQVYRLQQKVEEIKRMENEEFDKIRHDEVKLRKELDEYRLKFRRASDELAKLKQKEEEIVELRTYFSERKHKEEEESIKLQLKHEREKLSLLGLIRHRNKQPILCVISYLELQDLNIIAMLNKSYRNAL